MIHPNTIIELYLIRHGQSENNLNADILGGQSPKVQLSEHGKKQCFQLCEYFDKYELDFDLVFSSPLDRAKKTAEISLGNRGAPIYIDNRLMEYSAGKWEGAKRSKAHTPRILYRMAEMGMDFQPPDGESQRMVEQRVYDWLQEKILSEQNILHSARRFSIAVFSHGLTIKCLLHRILGFDSIHTWRLEIENASINKLIYNSRGWWLCYINRVPY